MARISAWRLGSSDELAAGLSVTVEAHAEGDTEVTVQVPGLETSIPLEVH